MHEPVARVGDQVEAIDTPALVIDLDAMERNLAALAQWARERGLRLRPHAKTHKCARIAALQIAAGAVGVCVQKVGEAEAMVEGGVADVYISNEVVSPAKLQRVARLAMRARLSIAVDCARGIELLAEAMRNAASHTASKPAGVGRASIDVHVEIDVGQGRCGADPRNAGELARLVSGRAADGLRFAGLQAYHGGAQHRRQTVERGAAIEQAGASVRTALASLAEAGIECPLVTGAGTGSFALEAASGLWGELQAGSYVFMDRDYADNEALADTPRFEHALFVKSTVMSRSATHAVVDAGHKSHAIDSGPPAVWTPATNDAPGRINTALACGNGGDEHGILRPLSPGAGAGALPALGDTVWLVPGHCDPTVNLHDQYVVVRGGLRDGRVEAIWRVDARGAVR